MSALRDSIMGALVGKVVASDADLRDAIIALIDASSAKRLDQAREAVRLKTLTNGTIPRFDRDALTR